VVQRQQQQQGPTALVVYISRLLLLYSSVDAVIECHASVCLCALQQQQRLSAHLLGVVLLGHGLQASADVGIKHNKQALLPYANADFICWPSEIWAADLVVWRSVLV
jgi:hypothetical protein